MMMMMVYLFIYIYIYYDDELDSEDREESR